MNVQVAILIGASLIGGSVVWAADHAAKDARCAGYLASDSGGLALYRLSLVELDSAQRMRQAGEDVEAIRTVLAADRDGTLPFLDSLRMAGCRITRPE